MERHIRVRILAYFGAHIVASSITEQQILAFRRALLAGTAPRNSAPGQRRANGPLRIANVNKHIITLRCLLRFGVQEGYLLHNPAERVKNLKKKPDPRHRAVPVEELDALRNQLTEPHRLWLNFMVETGCRENEAALITWNDLDLVNRQMTVRASTAKDADNRVVPLTQTAIDGLAELEPSPSKRRGLLFGKKDRRYSLVTAWERTGLPGRAPSAHDFRHTFASAAVAAGVDIESLRDWLGHDSIVTTQTYIHAYGDQQDANRIKLDELKRKEAGARAEAVRMQNQDQEARLQTSGDRLQGETQDQEARVEASASITQKEKTKMDKQLPAGLPTLVGMLHLNRRTPNGGGESPVSHILSHSVVAQLALQQLKARKSNDIKSTGGRTRTGTGSPQLDFESSASTNFATPAAAEGISTFGGCCQAFTQGTGDGRQATGSRLEALGRANGSLNSRSEGR